MSIFRFTEGYVERIWGGCKLHDVYSKDVPEGVSIGEAWLVSDHPQHESIVAEGPRKGVTLAELLTEDRDFVLGSRASLTPHGRFPLLLKLLDAGDKLSIQVHPDDAVAERLHEPDVGKTEMWHVLQADSGATLYKGLSLDVDRGEFERAADMGETASLLNTFEAEEGMSVFVPAGIVHAIGGGCMLAEIQQNSDLTYRIDDWGRLQADGSPRELHLEKALQSIHFEKAQQGAAVPLAYEDNGVRISILAACRYFAAEEIEVKGNYHRSTSGESFYLVLGKSGELQAAAGEDRYALNPGEALLVCGGGEGFSVEGSGRLLVYYVPDLGRDIVEPLLEAGHYPNEISALGGDPAVSDIKC